MDALGVEPYAVVGHSMGGAVALALAAARPRQVTHVVAVSTMGAPGAPLSADLDAIWAAPAGPIGARDMLSRLVLDQSLVTESAVAARAEAMQRGGGRVRVVVPSTPGTLGRGPHPLGADAGGDPRARAARPRRRGPGHPARDRGPALLEHLADVRLHVLGRCGHVPALEHPQDFRELLSCFLGRERGH